MNDFFFCFTVSVYLSVSLSLCLSLFSFEVLIKYHKRFYHRDVAVELDLSKKVFYKIALKKLVYRFIASQVEIDWKTIADNDDLQYALLLTGELHQSQHRLSWKVA